jgi:hypothetical protein
LAVGGTALAAGFLASSGGSAFTAASGAACSMVWMYRTVRADSPLPISSPWPSRWPDFSSWRYSPVSRVEVRPASYVGWQPQDLPVLGHGDLLHRCFGLVVREVGCLVAIAPEACRRIIDYAHDSAA